MESTIECKFRVMLRHFHAIFPQLYRKPDGTVNFNAETVASLESNTSASAAGGIMRTLGDMRFSLCFSVAQLRVVTLRGADAQRREIAALKPPQSACS